MTIRGAGIGVGGSSKRCMQNRVGRTSTTGVVVVSVMSLCGRLEWWKRVEVWGKVRMLTRTRVVVGRHHRPPILLGLNVEQ